MPASYTHHLVASQTLARLSPSLQALTKRSLPLYFFGAQGPDFYFFYPTLQRKDKALGSFLHRNKIFESFSVLKSLSVHNPLLLPYALGYITHYAADSVFHPYVYATAGNSTLRHVRLESMLDIRFKRQYHSPDYENFFRKKLSVKERDTLFLFYTALAYRYRLTLPKKTAFTLSISLFNAYPPMPNAIFDGYNEQLKSYVANEEKRLWTYPANERITSRESADELFQKSVTLAKMLIIRFMQSLHTNTPLPKDEFGKGFLTGI